MRVAGLISVASCVLIAANVALGVVSAQPQPASDRFDSHGVSLAYVVAGSGEPVVLIHGLYQNVRRSWENTGTLDMLAADYRVIALDLPGHGQSDKPDGPDAYGLAMVDDVVALLDHLQIKKAHVVGYSMGGMITMKLLATHPDRVRSALVGGMGWMQEGSLLADVFERLQGNGRGQTPPACVQSLGKLALSAEDLQAIHVPLVIVVGSQDPVLPLFVEPLRKARPDLPVIDVNGANHSTLPFRPEFKRAILDALKAAPSAQ